MIDGIPIGAIVNGIGVVGVVLVGGWMLATGRLFTRRQYDEVLHDRNEWRAEARIKDAQIAEKDEQVATKDRQLSHLSEVGMTMRHVLSALQRLGGGNHEEAQR